MIPVRLAHLYISIVSFPLSFKSPNICHRKRAAREAANIRDRLDNSKYVRGSKNRRERARLIRWCGKGRSLFLGGFNYVPLT